MDKYIKNVYKALGCKKEERARIINDLRSDILLAMESGENWNEIEIRLGLPKDYAKEFNENLGVVKKPAKKSIIGIACGIIVAIGCFVGYQYLSAPKTIDIKESKIFSEEKLVNASKQVIEYVNAKNYEGLESACSNDLIKVLNIDEIDEAKKELGELGKFEKVIESQFVEYKNKNETAAVGDIVTSYERRTVIYRLSFNENMKLIGIYMR